MEPAVTPNMDNSRSLEVSRSRFMSSIAHLVVGRKGVAPSPQVRVWPAWKCVHALVLAHIQAHQLILCGRAGAPLARLEMRLAYVRPLTSRHTNPTCTPGSSTSAARRRLSGSAARRLGGSAATRRLGGDSAATQRLGGDSAATRLRSGSIKTSHYFLVFLVPLDPGSSTSAAMEQWYLAQYLLVMVLSLVRER